MTQKTGPTLLVTVGSTLFQDLTDAVLAPSTLEALRSLGVARLVVQLGSAAVPSHLGIGRDGGTAQVAALEVTVVRYTNGPREMEEMMRGAHAVVSHAGSGTILAALRMPRPLLVVPNAALMDNHQQELAEALKKGGYLEVAGVDELVPGLQRLFATNHTPFPPFKPQRFAAILDETAGFF